MVGKEERMRTEKVYITPRVLTVRETTWPKVLCRVANMVSTAFLGPVDIGDTDGKPVARDSAMLLRAFLTTFWTCPSFHQIFQDIFTSYISRENNIGNIINCVSATLVQEWSQDPFICFVFDQYGFNSFWFVREMASNCRVSSEDCFEFFASGLSGKFDVLADFLDQLFCPHRRQGPRVCQNENLSFSGIELSM